MSAPEPRDDVQEFAALLRALKERTDRSYGSLARRLHMNTSTLHRYCAGDAVPVDFAPVERFAALCGASADERMDLHRLWLSAVAARQRPRAGETVSTAAGAGPAGGTVTEPAGGEESGAGATGGVTAAADVPHAAGGGARAAGGEADAAPGAAAGNGDTAGGGSKAAVHGAGAAPGAAAGDRDTVAGSAATGEGALGEAGAGVGGARGEGAAGEAEALLAGRGGPPGRPWYRRRRFVMTAAAAVALLATLGSLSALPSGRSASDEVAQAPDPSSRTRSSGTPDRSPSTSPSPSATSGSPSPKSTRNTPSASATGGGAAPKGTGGAGTQGAVTGTPLTWTVNSHVWNAGCGHDYVIDKPPAQVPPPPAAQDAANWAGTLGAIHGRQTMVQISVQGRSSTAVVLEDLRVRVVSRGAPAKGNSYAMEQGCGGALTPRQFSVDLDKDRPIAHSQPGNDGENVIPAVRMPYRVSSEDPEILLVTAETETCDCGWYLELDWSSQGRTGTARIDDHDRPFRTTGIQGLPRYWYGTNTAGERAWVDYDG